MNTNNQPVKICISCYTLSYSATRICRGCGREFYPSKTDKIDLPPTGILTGGFGSK